MRIISGEFKSRKLFTPRDESVTRPIPDRVKESLFSILRGHMEDATIFDGFAGTGAIGLEAISRGASKCVFVEQNRDIARVLQQNIDLLGVHDRATLVTGDALGPGALARCPRPLKLAFLDPPYPLVQEPVGLKRVLVQAAALVNLLSEDGFLVIRTPWPLRFEVGGAPTTPEEETEHKPRKERRRGERHSWYREEQLRAKRLEEEAAGTYKGPDYTEELTEAEWKKLAAGEEIDELGEVSDVKAAGVEAPAKTHWEDADLTISNADGPETHEYKTMALHIYARKRSGAEAAAPGDPGPAGE